MSAAFELRDQGDGTVRFQGYACVTGHPYEVGSFVETIAKGAFKRTLSESPDVSLLVNHDGLPLARTPATLQLAEDSRGLHVTAELDGGDPQVQSLRRKFSRGDLDGQMSFSFRTADQEWSEDRSKRLIRSVTIHRGDVSIVTQGANDATSSAFRVAAYTLEQRLKHAEAIGVHVRGVRGGRILEFGGVTPPAGLEPRSRHLALPDYTSGARLEYERLAARAGVSFYAEERAWLARKRAEMAADGKRSGRS